jgi:hypothetical protein
MAATAEMAVPQVLGAQEVWRMAEQEVLVVMAAQAAMVAMEEEVLFCL